jgi:hypothetical protein
MKKLLFLIVTIFCLQSVIAQCNINRHSTTWYDGWISCQTSPNPIASNGNTHWIRYDLGFVYPLFKSTIWNANEPDNLDYGVMDYKIDYSTNGTTWTNLGSFTLSQASGFSIYEGEEGPNFGGVQARYVLITPTSNYGGSCYGLSEVKFNLDPALAVIDEEFGYSAIVYPNPFNEQISIKINSDFPNEPISYSLYDLLGRKIRFNTLPNQSEMNNLVIPSTNLASGIYFVKILHNNKQKSFKIIKE